VTHRVVNSVKGTPPKGFARLVGRALHARLWFPDTRSSAPLVALLCGPGSAPPCFCIEQSYQRCKPYQPRRHDERPLCTRSCPLPQTTARHPVPQRDTGTGTREASRKMSEAPRLTDIHKLPFLVFFETLTPIHASWQRISGGGALYAAGTALTRWPAAKRRARV